MFHEASLFDANLSRWDVSNVTEVIQTFAGATSFQGVGVDRWNISQVYTM